MRSLSWLFRLVDKSSGPARSIASELAAVERQMKAVDRASRQARLAGAQNSAQGRNQLRALALQRQHLRDVRAELAENHGGGVAGGFEVAGMAASRWLAVATTIATVSIGAAVGVGRLAYAFGDAVVEATAFREGTLASLQTVLGSQLAAQRAFTNAIRIANLTPLDTTDVVSMMSNFAVAGFRENELQPLVAAAADLSAARGSAAADSFTRVIAQIRGLGRVTRGDITMQAISAGLNAGDIFDSIARQMNAHGSTTAEMRRAAERLVSQGKVSADVGIRAFLDATERAYDNGGPLGTFARRQSETLVGALSNAHNAATNLLLSLDLEKIPGIVALRRVILSITAALDAGSPTGKRLASVLRQLSDALFGGIFGNISDGGIRAFLGRVLDGVEGFVGFARQAIPVGRAFFEGVFGGAGSVLGPAATMLRAMFGGKGQADIAASRERAAAFGQQLGQILAMLVLLIPVILTVGVKFANMVATIAEGVAHIEGYFAEVGKVLDEYLGNKAGSVLGVSLIAGFRTGLTQAMPGALGDAVRFGSGVISTVKGVLGIASPSKVFAEIGRFSAQGFAEGLNAGRVGAQGAAGRMVDAPEARRIGGGGGHTFNVNVTVQGGDDPEDTGRRVGRAALDELVDGIELLNLQMG